MRVGVIDVGSNSVRVAVFSGGSMGEKRLITCRLGEGMADGFLRCDAIERTADAIEELKNHAFSLGAEVVYAFATEAVRKAENKQELLSLVRQRSGLEIAVVDGETEAELALIGALGGSDGAVIDLGGASTEIAVKRGGRTVYAVSAPIGAVTLRDACGRDKNKIVPYIAQKTAVYGEVPSCAPVVAVGGTATSLACCHLRLKVYDPKRVEGTVLSAYELEDLACRFEGKLPSEIAAEYAVDGRRAEIIFGGAMLLRAVLERTGADRLTVSESDNIEGFYNLLCRGGVSAVGAKRENNEAIT